MDVFDHAFMLNYGLKRADYIETFFKNIDWKAVESRYDSFPRPDSGEIEISIL